MKKLWRYQLSSFFFILAKINHGFIVVKCSNVFGRFITICIGQFYYKYHGLRYNVLMFDTTLTKITYRNPAGFYFFLQDTCWYPIGIMKSCRTN